MRDLIEAVWYPNRIRESVGSKSPGRFYYFLRRACRGIFACTMRVKAHGLEHLAGEGAMLVAVSHVGHLDPIVVSALAQRGIGWVSRIEFYRWWPMRVILYLGGAFAVDRQGAALPTIREGLRRLARGDVVGIFPEGEMMSGSQSVLRGAQVKRGVCILAARSGCPVVPVVLLGAERLQEVGPWLPAKRGRLWIWVGEPMHATEEAATKPGRDEFAARLEAEYVRLFKEAREVFGLEDSIVP